MKNLLIMLLSACVFSTHAQPNTEIKGNLFQDATDLKKLIVEKKIAEALHIIFYYTRDVNGDRITDPVSIIERLKENPLLLPLLPKNIIDSLTSLPADKRLALFKKTFEVTGGALVQGGGLESIFPASTIVDGLGTFIAERFKEELTMRYLENFRRKLIEGDENLFYSKLLPETYQALQSYPNVFDYKAFLTVLREAFKDDLDHISQNILPFIDLNLTEAQMNSSEVYIGLATFDLLLNKIPQSVNALEAVAGLRQNEYFIRVDDTSTVKKALILTSLLTETLKNAKGYLDSKADFGIFIKEFRDTQYDSCFFGLFIQQHYNTLKNISFSNNDLVHVISENFGKFQGVAGHLVAIQVTLQNYRNPEAAGQNILKLVTSLNTDLKKLVDELSAFVPEAALEDLRKVLRISERFLAMSNFAIEEKYGLVIIEVLKTIEEINLRDTNPMLYEGLNTYGLFIANVAQAKSGQEVKEALDVAALPVGSYKIKRNSMFDISFNAYPGVALGMEFRSGIPATAEEEVEKSIASIAFAVPVGIGFSWGSMKETTTKIRKGQKRETGNQNEFKIKETLTLKKDSIIRTVRSITGSSHSVFVSMIDIGAITSFRLTDEETEKLPEFTWENILAPGLFYFYGFKNSPLSLGIGVQYGPQLRTLTDSDVKIADSLVSARILLSVDVPIFNFFSRTGVKKKLQKDPEAFYK